MNIESKRPGIYTNVPDNIYHGLEVLDFSSLVRVRTSPADYKMLKEEGWTTTDAMRFGSAYHLYMLEHERFVEEVCVMPDVKLNTNAGKEELSEWLIGQGLLSTDELVKAGRDAIMSALDSAGKTVITEKDLGIIKAMCKMASTHESADLILCAEAHNEMSLIGELSYTNMDTGDVMTRLMKGRIDKWIPSSGQIVDLKTTVDAHPMKFGRAIYDRGYHIQAYIYTQLCSVNGMESNDYLFLAQEKDRPYKCAVHELDRMAIEVGKVEFEQLMTTLERCEREDRWPGYGDEITLVKMPAYAYNVLADNF